MQEEKENKTRNVFSQLRSRIFGADNTIKNGPFLLYIFGCMMLMIQCSHMADQKVYKKKKLQTELREVRSQHVARRRELMEHTKPSKVIEKVKEIGLDYSFETPLIVEVKE
jgi:hypothetical protein